MLTEIAPELRLELITRYAESRRETDRLFAILGPVFLYERPIPERHRIVFYIGHLEAFDWNLLRTHLALQRFNAEFDQLFAFGIDPVDGGLPGDPAEAWPAMAEVERYRNRIRREVDSALENAPDSEELVELMNIAIEHRLMHAETLEYMLHQLPYEAKIRPAAQPVPAARAISPAMIEVPTGSVTLGLERNSGQFGWDNEFDAQRLAVPAFSIDKYKISNGQFARFMEDGGYDRREFWPEADWDWKTKAGIAHPVFWVPSGGDFRYRGMFEESALPANAPVYVSHAEACAYARWAAKDLPTEAQWQRAAEGAQLPRSSRAWYDPPPTGSAPELASVWGVEDLFGTGWEWTATPFSPFPGFRATAAYPGYSANFFDNKHFVMKGGSTRTAACMLRASFRNWFQAHYQYVYAGFRCVAR